MYCLLSRQLTICFFMIVKDGIPFVIVPIVIALIFAFFYLWIFVAIFVFLAAFMAFFFRNPNRITPDEPDLIISSADGKVTRIEDRDEGKFVSVDIYARIST